MSVNQMKERAVELVYDCSQGCYVEPSKKLECAMVAESNYWY